MFEPISSQVFFVMPIYTPQLLAEHLTVSIKGTHATTHRYTDSKPLFWQLQRQLPRHFRCGEILLRNYVSTCTGIHKHTVSSKLSSARA